MSINNNFLSFLILVFLNLVAVNANANQMDSLLNLLEQEEIKNDVKQLADVYINIGRDYYKNENFNKSIQYYNQALEIAENENLKTNIWKSHYGLGLGNQRKNNFQKSLYHFHEITSLEDGQIPPKTKAASFSQISSIYQALGDYEKAYDFQMQALYINEINELQNGIANSHYNLGNIFFYQDQFASALKHYEKASKICKKEGNKVFIFSTSSALGSTYQKMGNYETSIRYNEEALTMATELNYNTGIGYAKANLAANYLYKKEYKKAETLLQEANQIKEKLGDKYGVIGTKIDMGELYFEWDKNDKAILNLHDALALAIELKSRSRQAEIYNLLTDVHEDEKEHVTALMFSKKYTSLRDSLISEKTLEEMGQSKARFELKEKENQITILKKEQKIQKLQMVLFGCFLLGVTMFLWRYKKQLSFQQKTNLLLEEKNEEIKVQYKELQYTQDELLKTNILLEDQNVLLEKSNLTLNDKNEEIKVKNIQLKNSNTDLQQFAYVASHDLKEPLRMIHSYTSLLEKRYNHLYDAAGKEFIYYVVDAAKRMQNLLDDLLDFSKVGTQKPPEKAIELSDIMILVETNLKHRLESFNGSIVIQNKALPAVKIHRTQLIQLFQNLISNGLKFKADRDPIVLVDYQQQEKEIIFSIKDNGIGISPKNLKKVFEMFKRLHDQSEYEGTGIGLATCKRIVNGWGGEIWVDSIYGEGSTFFFSIPNTVVENSMSKAFESLNN